MSYYVYLLESIEHSKKYYVGMAKNVESRLQEHNLGKSKYTKSLAPWRLVHFEFVGEAIEARKLEKYYKSTAGKNKLRKLNILKD